MGTGFILFAFVCYSTPSADVGQHDCQVVKGALHQTYDECKAAGALLEESLERNGFRLIEGVCREPLMSEREYVDPLTQKEGSF